MIFGKCGYMKLCATIIAVTTGVFVSVVSVLQFSHFLSGVHYYPSDNLPSDIRIYYRIIVNWSLASCYLYLPSLIECIVQKIGNLCGLPDCYFKFIKNVLLLSALNAIIAYWQNVPEICLWNINIRYAESIHFYLHFSLWIISFLIMVAIDITEIMGIKSILYYNITSGSRCSFKSQQFDTFLLNIGLPGSSCIIIILWAQKVMRLLLAVIWTLGILSCNQTDDKDIKYVARQIEKKRTWMYFSEKITISPLK
ncbi:nurim isoform X2 [Sipha flava]|uniref:Nuclear envelope membrane protein n=1 Tax=Sipha flava TaxID=143950 RepID=A0A8B8FP70_9HEMI|nr:nurim isoform X2 [Sipha flava]